MIALRACLKIGSKEPENTAGNSLTGTTDKRTKVPMSDAWIVARKWPVDP